MCRRPLSAVSLGIKYVWFGTSQMKHRGNHLPTLHLESSGNRRRRSRRRLPKLLFVDVVVLCRLRGCRRGRGLSSLSWLLATDDQR